VDWVDRSWQAWITEDDSASVSMSPSHKQAATEPLTRRNADREVYRREPAVEQQIAAALGLDPAALLARAQIADEAATEFLKEECLVYLIRRAQREGQIQIANDLSAVLLRRCAALIQRRLGSLGREGLEDGFDDLAEQLFGRILDLRSDRGDFLQVRFWIALERLAIRAYDQRVRETNRARRTVSLAELAGYDCDDELNHTILTRESAAVATPSDDAFVIQNDLIRDAVSRIEPPYRTAFLLRYFAGWPIEHQDPSVRTISRHFGRDPRTIRNWLRRAEEALQQWRGEQQ